jgi:hypothetical protein
MQSEFTASAIAWSFSTFSKNKCLVKAFSSINNSDHIIAEHIESSSGKHLHACSSSEPLIVSQGTPLEIGLEFSPSPSFNESLDDFIESFEKHKELLKFDLQMKLGDRNYLPRETADIQKHINVQQHSNLLDCIIFRRNPGGFFIGD